MSPKKIPPPKDMFFQEITVGDLVVFNPPYYKGIVVGEVLSFTRKTVKCQYNGEQESNIRTAEVVRVTDLDRLARETHPEEFI